MINIVGLGPGSIDFLTVGALRALNCNEKIFLRTENHEIANYLKEKNIKYKSYDYFYNNLDNKNEIYNSIAEDIINNQKKFDNIIYAVPGHPLIAEKTVMKIIEICKEQNIEYKILPSTSFIDIILELLNIDPMDGLKIIDALDIENKVLDKRFGTIIAQVYNNIIAREVKEKLLDFYNENTEITVINNLKKEHGNIINIKLRDLDSVDDININTFLYIKKDLDNKKDFKDLIDLVETLRGDNGCPWDMEQTSDSIKNETLEEVYELVDAINNKDIDNIIEELGDVLFHVVFHASVGKKDKNFNMTDVLDRIINKMIFRHPHVFGDGKVAGNSEEVLVKWDELKKREKNYKTITEEMKLIAKTLPALTKAHKVQKKAAKIGFDFDNVEEASKKVIEELNEVLDVYKTGNKEKIYNEVGDLIFSCVNISRILKVNEEEALNLTINKFINRFSYIENEALKLNKNLNDMSLEEMDAIWEKSKTKENNKF